MKKILSIILVVAMCLGTVSTALAAELKFTDVPKSEWYYNDVKTAVEMGLVNGKSDTSYAPNDNLTYAEAIKLAACMNQLYNDGEVTLKGGDPWYQPYVEYCKENKIITKDYNVDSFATRAGYMGIFANALPEEGLKKINNVPDNSIPDVPSSKEYAAGVYKLYRAGILQGVDEEHNCNPLANITRAEVAAILTRMMNPDKRVKFNMGTTNGGSGGGSAEVDDSLKVKNLTGDELEIKHLKTGNVEVKATGGKAPYEYKWEYNFNGKWNTVAFAGGDQYTFTDGKGTNTLEITGAVDDSSNGMLIRCVVTDAEGNSVTSDETKIVVLADELKIENLTGAELKIPDLTTGKVQVKATGGKAPYTYKWEYNFDGRWITVAFAGGDQYTFTGEKNTDTLDILVSVDDSSADMKIRCTVTDANGNSVTSDETHTIAVAEEVKEDGFLMYVEDVYTITGRGTVATGRVVAGELNTGDSIQIISADGTKTDATVAGIEMFRKLLDKAKTGDNIGLLFNEEITRDNVARGDSIIGADAKYSVTATLKGTFTLISKEEGGRASGIADGHTPQFYRSGHDFTGKITGLTNGTINPGETQENVTATFPTFKGVFYVGQKLDVREGGRTIGSFTITSIPSGGRESIPSGKTEYMDSEAGGRQSNPSGKSQYMD